MRTLRIEGVHEGEHWFLSSTGPAGPPRELAAGKTLRIDAAAEVRFAGVVRQRGKSLQLGFGIKSAEGRGLSVYRNGKRVPVTYELFSRDGKVVASGAMNYG